MICRFLLAIVSSLAACVSAHAEPVWLVVGASDASPARIAQKSKALFEAYENGLIVQTHDCGDKNNVFAWVADVAPSAKAAQETVNRVRAAIKDAYVKRCDVKPGSLLALRVSAVDKSIANVPQDAVNWEDRDRISSTQDLGEGKSAIIVRYYAATPDDPLEGRRERVMLAAGDRRITLDDNCVNPSRVLLNHDRVVFHCVREQAGTALLHSVFVFSTTGEKLAEIDHCRNPKWAGERTVVCDEETVNSNGKLELTGRRTNVAIPGK